MADATMVYRAHPTQEEIDDVLAQRLSAAVGTLNEGLPWAARPALTPRCRIAGSRATYASGTWRTVATVAGRKRKTIYPPARTDNKPAQRPGAGPEPYVRPTVATIDLTAGGGRAGLAVGDRVRIAGAGLYAGEAAVIEKMASGVIPAALVRTEAGNTRTVRTIDLEPIAREG